MGRLALAPKAKTGFMPARVGRNRLVGFRRVGEGRIPSMIRMALPRSSNVAGCFGLSEQDEAGSDRPCSSRRYTHRVQVFGMPWQGRQLFSIAHPSIPSRWEGKKYRLSNDLFPLPTGGGEGWAVPARYSVRDGYILGVTALVGTIDVLYGFVCVPAASGNGMRTCPVMPACIAGIQNTGT